MAVDETWDRGEPAPVELLDLAAKRRQLRHRTDRGDLAAVAEDVASLDHVELAERRPAQRRSRPAGDDDLREVANQQPRHGASARSAAEARAGPSPCSRAASSASS